MGIDLLNYIMSDDKFWSQIPPYGLNPDLEDIFPPDHPVNIYGIGPLTSTQQQQAVEPHYSVPCGYDHDAGAYQNEYTRDLLAFFEYTGDGQESSVDQDFDSSAGEYRYHRRRWD